MYTKFPRALICLLYLLLIAGALYLAGAYILPWIMPFLIALALAGLLEPLVSRLCRRKCPRSLASGLCTAGGLFIGGGAIFLLVNGASSALTGLSVRLPELVSGAADLITDLEDTALRYIASAPGDSGRFLTGALESVRLQLSALPQWISGKLIDLLSSAAAKGPSVLLFSITAGIGAYFISSSYPAVTAFLARQLPNSAEEKLSGIKQDLRFTAGRWLRAQLLMMLMTFAELLLAFLLLRVRYSFYLALIVSVIDALPVFGTGTVLLPWAVFEFLDGDPPMAIGLVITYALVTLLRNCVQPKLLGDQLGLPPIVTLLAIYLGYRVMGIWGMLGFPIAAIMLKLLNDRGVVHLWKSGQE